MSDPAPPFPIYVCGLDELAGHGETGATHVLSILDPDWPVPEAFGQYGEHERIELRFHDNVVERPGEISPTRADVEQVLAFGRKLQAEPSASLLVHCHAGISRSTASMVLILAQALPERSAEEIVAMVHGIREKAWPNIRIIEMGDSLLGRGGTLIAAVTALHAKQLEKRPHLAELMTEAGRGREVEAASAG